MSGHDPIPLFVRAFDGSLVVAALACGKYSVAEELAEKGEEE